MNIIDTLKTNRSEGYYNVSDLNRVGSSIKYISDCLAASHVSVVVKPKYDYTMQCIPEEKTLLQILTDIRTLWTAVASFNAQLTSPTPTYGYYELTDEVKFDDIVQITAFNAINIICLTLACDDCSGLSLSGEGWAVQKIQTSIQASYQYACGKIEDTDEILGLLTLSFDTSQTQKKYANITVSVSATGRSGLTHATSKSARVIFSCNDWDLVQHSYNAWLGINGTIWNAIENMKKPTEGTV